LGSNIIETMDANDRDTSVEKKTHYSNNEYYNEYILWRFDFNQNFLCEILCYIDQQQPSTGSPDNINDLEKNYVDAKAYILSATTKDGANL
jgi:hypothetical protein